MSFIDRIKGLFGGAGANGEAGDSTDPDQGMVSVEGEMISCHDALRLVHDYLDGELEAISQAQVKAHFDVCQQCYPHLHLETSFRDAMRRAVAGEKAPPELREKLVALLAEADREG